MRTFEHSGPPVPYWLIRIREEDLKHLTSTQKKKLLRNHEPWIEERWAKRENATAEQISKRDGFYNLYLEFIRTDDSDQAVMDLQEVLKFWGYSSKLLHSDTEAEVI